MKGLMIYGNDIERLTELYIGEVYKYSNLISIISNVIAIPLMLLFMRLDKKRRYREGTIEVYDKTGPLFYAAVLFLGAAAAITANNLINISGLINLELEEQEELAKLIYSGTMVIEILAVVILAPIAEELVFRGLVFRRLRENTSFKMAAFISALFFALYHGNLVQGVYAFMLGLLMAFVCERFKSVLASIVFHIGANGFSVLATETSMLDIVEKSNAAALIYIIVGAALTLFFLWIVYEKVHPRLLIPAASAGQEESGT